MLEPALIAAGVALIAALACTPLARGVARRLGAVDQPGGRRVHVHATPRMGGLGVLVAYLVALVATWAWARATGEATGNVTPVLGFLGGGVFLAIVGAFDDVKALGAKKKLAGQIVAATIAWSAGARIEAFDLPWIGSFEFGMIASYCATLVWILAFVNAVNLIDGLDGLASGIVLFAAVTNSIVAFVTDNALACVLNAALGGAVLGFLRYNFNPATVFLGDTGSMFLGYALGAAALLTGRQKESTVIALLVPVVALGVPITDTLFTMARRFLERRPIFSADRGHIHHRLLDLGLTHRRVVLFLYATSVITCVAALVAAFGKDWQAGLALTVAVSAVLGGALFAGYFRQKTPTPTPLPPEAEAIRRGLPELLRETPEGEPESYFKSVVALMEASPPFLAVELTAPENRCWQWAAAGTEDTEPTIEYVFDATLADGAVRMRFVVSGRERSDRVETLLQLVADRARAELAYAAPSTSRISRSDHAAIDERAPLTV